MITSQKVLSEQEDTEFGSFLRKHDCRDSLIFTLLYTYGMRQGELLSLKRSHFNAQSKTLFIKALKGSKDREFPLTDELCQRLTKQLSSHNAERIFPISRSRLFALWQHWRPTNKKLHSLRHTAAVRVYRKHRDVQLVQRILGHKSLNSTLVYQDFAYSQDELRGVFNV